MVNAKRDRTYSRVNQLATGLLGLQIRQARKQHNLSAQEVAERAGISRTTLQKIEKGDPTTEIGLVFEVATIVGVTLFDEAPDAVRAYEARLADHISLMPRRKRPPPKINDDF